VLGLPEAVQESWEQFKSGPLAEMNRKNTCDLVHYWHSLLHWLTLWISLLYCRLQ